MNTQDALQKAESLLQPIASEFTRPAPNRLDAIVAAGQLPAAVQALTGSRWGFLSALTGLDVPPSPPPKPAPGVEAPAAAPAEGSIEALYHFCEGDAVTTLRVKVPYSNASVPSICPIIPSATLYERELAEMFGVTVVNTPDPDHLLLPDDWPAGVYPLRKSFTGKTEAAPATGV